MANLLAACRVAEALVVKRVRTNQAVQEKLGPVFALMETLFYDGVDDETEFDGSWKPDDNELIYIDGNAEAAALVAEASGNVIELPEIDTANFSEENIRALIVATGPEGHHPTKLLLQAFSKQQILNRKFTLIQQENSFKQMTENAFTIGPTLSAIIDGNRLKFRSFHNLRKIFDLVEFYKAATDEELVEFCSNEKLSVQNVGEFLGEADQIVRKLVHKISDNGVLEAHDVGPIVAKAQALGIALAEQDGKLVMPNDRKAIKVLLRFLDDAVYEAPLSQLRYQTNSKRQL